MNPARLAELKHQRALVHEQLAWLEREIAAESTGVPPRIPLAAVNPAPALHEADVLPPTSSPLVPSSEFQATEAYQPDPVATATNTRKGCFVALAVFTVLVVATFALIYVLRYSDRPLLFMPADSAAPGANAPTSSPPRH